MWHYLKEILISFARIPFSFYCKTQPALGASKYFRCLLPSMTLQGLFEDLISLMLKNFICQDHHGLICSQPAPENTVVLVPSWHLGPRSAPPVAVHILISIFLPCK